MEQNEVGCRKLLGIQADIHDTGACEMVSIVIVYSAPLCGHCMKLKEFLQLNDIRFEEKDIRTAESLTDFRVNGCFSIGAPVLRIGDQFLSDKQLFEGEDLQENVLMQILEDR
jgi:glutaredoxin